MRALLGELTLMVSVIVLLVAWAVLAMPVVFLAGWLGIDGQVALGAHSVLFFVGFWALGLWYLFDLGGGDGPESA